MSAVPPAAPVPPAAAAAPARTITTRDAAGARRAAVTAGWVAAVLAAIAVIDLLFSSLPWAAWGAINQPDFGMLGFNGMLFDFARQLFVTIVPFAGGVFLSLWLVLAVDRGTPLIPTLGRGLVASAIGAALATLVGFLATPIFGGSSDPWQLVSTILATVSLAAHSAPVVLLVLVIRGFAPRRETPVPV